MLPPKRLCFLFCLAFARLIGHGLNLTGGRIDLLASLTAASPKPLVFTSFRGLETFATSFHVSLVVRHTTTSSTSRSTRSTRSTRSSDNGRFHYYRTESDITPELYNELLAKAPYQYRNVIGAAFAYGPALQETPTERALVKSVLRHAFCAGGPLANGTRVQLATVSAYERKTDRIWTLRVVC
jgi:hypothetical protein